MRLRTRIGHFDHCHIIESKRFALAPIVEAHAIDIVNEGLSRHILGKNQGVLFYLDVIVAENRRNIGVAHDRRRR